LQDQINVKMNEELLLEGAERQEISNFKDTIIRHLKKWPWIVLCVAASVFVAYFYLQSKPNKYRVEGKVFIKKSQQLTDPNELLFGGRNSFRRANGITDEAVMFKSFPIIKSTLRELGFDVTYQKKGRFKSMELYQNSPIKIEFDRKLNDKLPLRSILVVRLLGNNEFKLLVEEPFEGRVLDGIFKFNQAIQLGSFNFVIQKNTVEGVTYNSDDVFYLSFNSIEKSAYAYRSMLKFDEVEAGSSILTMSMSTAVPKKSIDFVNKLIEKYIDQNLAEKNKVAENTVAFIDKQLKIISDSLNNKEANLEDFKSSGQMVDLSMEGQMLIENFGEIEKEKAGYEIRQQYYDYLEGNLKNKDGKNLEKLIAPSAFGIQDLIINNLVSRLIELNLNKKKLIQDGNVKSPLLAQIESTTNDLTKTLEGSISNLSKANKIVLNTLNERAEEINVSARQLPNSERRLVNLNRLLKLNENLYLFLMEKRSSAAITMSSNIADCKVIEPAMLNPLDPISPNRKMVYMVAIIIGMFLPILFFVGKDFLNDTIRGKDDIELGTQVPIIGSVPKTVITGSSMVVLERPKSAVAESFRIIRSNLAFFQGKKSPFVILVTSSIAKEGKTYCALNLASILASSGKKTVILGFDLRKPQLHSYLGIENGKGVSNYIAGRAEVDEILLPTDEKNLFVINSGAIPPNPAELLMEDRTKQLVQELKERFDYIIMDTPPVGIVTDALILKEEADMNLFVVRQNYSKREFLNSLNDLYTSKRMKNLTVLLNDVEAKSNNGYGYYEEDNNSLGEKIRKKVKKV
jgi:tyrosine-protein kinase Etk/Wzc